MGKQAKEVSTGQRGSLIPWKPVAEIARWERDMERTLANFLTGRVRPLFDDRSWPSSNLGVAEPSVDLYEKKDEIVVKAELPGLTKDDIQVSLADNILTIKGEKKKEEEDDGKDYYRSERIYGAFIRSLPLPAEVNPEKIHAAFKNGVLEVRLPKSEEAKKKAINVRVES
jgi:HSP20 family protein